MAISLQHQRGGGRENVPQEWQICLCISSADPSSAFIDEQLCPTGKSSTPRTVCLSGVNIS